MQEETEVQDQASLMTAHDTPIVESETLYAWFDKFNLAFLQLKFNNSPYDLCLFTHTCSRAKILLLLYVDDMTITGDNSNGIALLRITL